MHNPGKILIIQTASIGDVILATPLVESLRSGFPGSQIDFLLKKGNESLFAGHPHLSRIIAWDKNSSKNRNLLQLLGKIRRYKYDVVINLQRFASTGLITALSGAKLTIGFDKNPFSVLFHHRVRHLIHKGDQHEIDRNLSLLKSLKCPILRQVRLYPTESDYGYISAFLTSGYICIAPASLWFTKQFPEEKWIEFLVNIPDHIKICLVGSQNDSELCNRIIKQSGHNNAVNLAGTLSFLQTAALMQGAKMNYVNDSAPLHLASAMNAPVTAIFCSTVTGFGFGPLSEDSHVVETREALLCRPCGLHGFRNCPEKHFKCAWTINTEELLNRL